ncbi:hypothetical protein BH23PLA1_BH23PLA1_06960 [soil metagenome]
MGLMPRTLRSIVGLLILALYGSVSVSGNGLHGWLDLSHCCCHEEHAEQGEGSPGEPSLGWRAEILVEADDCLLCQFHIQGQLSSPAFALGLCESISTSVPLLSGRRVAVSIPLAHSPRAPPQG